MELRNRYILEFQNLLLKLFQIAFLKYLLKWDCVRKNKHTTRKPIYFCQIVKRLEKEMKKYIFLCNDLYRKVKQMPKPQMNSTFKPCPKTPEKKSSKPKVKNNGRLK